MILLPVMHTGMNLLTAMPPDTNLLPVNCANMAVQSFIWDFTDQSRNLAS